jgi:hypothetical protein
MAFARGRGEAPTDPTSAVTAQGTTDSGQWPRPRALWPPAPCCITFRTPAGALLRHISRMVSRLPKVEESSRGLLGVVNDADDLVVVAHKGSSSPAFSATMYLAYQSGQSGSALPMRFSCSPWAASARRMASASS